MIYSGNALIGLEYEIDSEERLVVSLADSGYEFRREAIPYEIETKTISGIIETSLFGAISTRPAKTTNWACAWAMSSPTTWTSPATFARATASRPSSRKKIPGKRKIRRLR